MLEPNYHSIPSGPPTVTSLSVVKSENITVFTLNCTSINSPATTVIWTKDREVVSDEESYQILRDGLTATFDNILVVNSTPDELMGTYSCSVLNSAGQSNVETLNVQGIIMST